MAGGLFLLQVFTAPKTTDLNALPPSLSESKTEVCGVSLGVNERHRPLAKKRVSGVPTEQIRRVRKRRELEW
jgi:hypothetical protein